MKPSEVLRYLRRGLPLDLESTAELPEPAGNLSRAELLNIVIRSIGGAKRYLEIGVNTKAQPGYSRDKIIASVVHGVDPNPETDADFVMTSDRFFQDYCDRNYDVIFIDGLSVSSRPTKRS